MSYRCFLYQLKNAAMAITVGFALAGCTGVVDFSEQIANQRLEMARTAYSQAKENPLVESYSLKTFLSAEKLMQDAEDKKDKLDSASASGSSKELNYSQRKSLYNEIARLAYLAERKSQTSVAQAEGVVARNEIVKLDLEKAEVQLQKSQLEQKILKQDLDEKAAALESAKLELDTATSEAERARILADIQAKEAALANAMAQAKATEAEKARAEAEALAREAQRAKDELAMLMKEMSELQGQLTDRGIVLTIGDVLFATGKSDLGPSAQRSMAKIAEFLETKQNRNLLVEGHTDNVGSDAYNQTLSEQRAASVKNALAKLGVAPDRIVTVGYGKKYPLASNDIASGRQQNRRVEAIILNEGVRPESQFRK